MCEFHHIFHFIFIHSQNQTLGFYLIFTEETAIADVNGITLPFGLQGDSRYIDRKLYCLRICDNMKGSL